jgi:putative PIN family toxin of toxin-antitoxin system
MRVVLDVNVWISGLLWRGVPGLILDLAENGQITIFASDVLFTELETTLRRAKFQPKIQSLKTTVEDLLSVAYQLSESCPTTLVDFPLLRDRDDAIILAAAEAIQAEAIITGDLDLLTLKQFKAIPILTPTDFLSRYFSI